MNFFNFRIVVFLLILLSGLATCAMPSQQELALIKEQQLSYGKLKETPYEYANFSDVRLLKKTIQSYEVSQFLNSIKCNVSNLWQDAIDSVFSEQTQIIDTQIWPEKFIDQVAKIELAINNAFDQHIRGYDLEIQNEKINIDSIKKIRDLLTKFSIITSKSPTETHFDLQMSAFLESVPTPSISSQHPRSTYVTKNFPVNAIILQDPTVEQFLDGIRMAILSYFKISCLAIRLQAGDSVIFDQLETPIMLSINPDTKEISILTFPEVLQDNFLSNVNGIPQRMKLAQRLGAKALSLYYKSFILFCVSSEFLSLYKAVCYQESIPSLQQKARQLKEHDALMAQAYSTLGLEPGSNQHEIEMAYRRAYFKYHPDKGGYPELFIKLNDMRDILINAAVE